MASVRTKARPKDEEPEPGAARIAWWKARLTAAAKAGELLAIPPGNLAAVLARFEVTRELARKGPKK
jgi:hypothetical protein